MLKQARHIARADSGKDLLSLVPQKISFQTLDRELVDGNVIAGHVVPDVLLFTRPLIKIEQKTATYTDKTSSIKVTAVIQLMDDNGNFFIFSLLGSGCSTSVEITIRLRWVFGLNPAGCCSLFLFPILSVVCP